MSPTNPVRMETGVSRYRGLFSAVEQTTFMASASGYGVPLSTLPVSCLTSWGLVQKVATTRQQCCYP